MSRRSKARLKRATGNKRRLAARFLTSKKGRLKGWLAGADAGYKEGLAHGIHLGHCRYMMNTYRQVSDHYPVKVLFVQEGTPGFTTIDKGIAHALGSLVDEVRVVTPLEHATEAARAFQPNLVLVLNGISEERMQQVAEIRQEGFPTAVWTMDDPYFSDVTAQFVTQYDYIFTHEKCAESFYRELGCEHAYYLPAAACPNTVYPQYVEGKYRYDVCFIGSAFPNRIQYFTQVTPHLKGIRLFLAGFGWNQLKDWPRLEATTNLRGVLYDENIKHYAGAKIVINLHRSPLEALNSRGIGATSPNPRTFDITGCGTLQLTDIRQELASFYTPGVHLDTFVSPEDLVFQIKRYLNDDPLRCSVARAGLYHTLHHHTYAHRITEMLGKIFG